MDRAFTTDRLTDRLTDCKQVSNKHTVLGQMAANSLTSSGIGWSSVIGARVGRRVLAAGAIVDAVAKASAGTDWTLIAKAYILKPTQQKGGQDMLVNISVVASQGREGRKRMPPG